MSGASRVVLPTPPAGQSYAINYSASGVSFSAASALVLKPRLVLPVPHVGPLARLR